MIRLMIVVVPCTLLLAACSSSNVANPLSAFGLMHEEKPQIDYSPRPPLVIPPEDQRSQLPPPQDTVTAPAVQTQQTQVVAPQSYETPAPQPANAPAEDQPWWTKIFGS